jgi:hypothetical protein
VDAGTRWRVAVALDLAAGILGLPPMAPRWVIPAPSGYDGFAPGHRSRTGRDLFGFAYQDEPEHVFLRADMTAHAMETALHEARHHHQWAYPGQYPDDATLLERDAEQWAAQTMEVGVFLR